MTYPTPPADRDRAPDKLDALSGTLPMIVLTALLLVGSYLTYLSYRQIGPDRFPIWGLLLTLGIVAALGSIVSWFFATDEGSVAPGEEGEQRSRPAGSPKIARGDYGRPAPDLVSPPNTSEPVLGGTAPTGEAAAHDSAPWSEDGLPPAAPRGPRPVLTTPDDPGDISRALEEIAEIQRQLASRPVAAPNANKAPARA
jgi:hypothetical protein